MRSADDAVSRAGNLQSMSMPSRNSDVVAPDSSARPELRKHKTLRRMEPSALAAVVFHSAAQPSRKMRAISVSMTASSSSSATSHAELMRDYEMATSILEARKRVELARQRKHVSFGNHTISLDKQFRTAPAGGQHLITLDSPTSSPRRRVLTRPARGGILSSTTSSLVAMAVAGMDDSNSSKEDDSGLISLGGTDPLDSITSTTSETTSIKKKAKKCVSFQEEPEDASKTTKTTGLVRPHAHSRPRCTGDPESENAHLMSPIHVACRKGDYLVVKHVLSYYVGREGVHLVNSACACGMTPLQVACSQGHFKIAQLLLQQHAKPNRRPRRETLLNDGDGRRTRSCLALACAAKSLEIVDLLLDFGARLDEDALVTASSLGLLQIVRTLLTAPQRLANLADSADVLARSSVDGGAWAPRENEIDPMWIHSAITAAMQSEQIALVQVLLGNGITPRSRQLVPRIALEATTRGDHKLLRCLTKMYDADLLTNARDSYGCTLLHLAVKRNSSKCVMLALRRGVDVEARDGCGITALYMACARGLSTIVHLLVTAGAKCERMGPNDETPLHIAAQENHLLCVETLLNDGSAPVDMSTSDKRTALHLACQCGHTEVAQCLLDHGADVNAKTTSDETPLVKATRMSNLATVKLLLSRHADTSVICSRGDLERTASSSTSSSMSTMASARTLMSLLKDEEEKKSKDDSDLLTPIHAARSSVRSNQDSDSSDLRDSSFGPGGKHGSFKQWLRNVMGKH